MSPASRLECLGLGLAVALTGACVRFTESEIAEVVDPLGQQCPDGSTPLTYFADADADGFGDGASPLAACAPPDGYVLLDTDCDDGDAGVFPQAPERCDQADNDCDGTVDEDGVGAPAWYADGDEDGFGAGDAVHSCTPAGVANNDDCDDTAAGIAPDAPETCDGVDNDCDGAVDEDGAVDGAPVPVDADADGFGSTTDTVLACDTTGALPATDCDDLDAAVNPGAAELCNGVDDDCDGGVDIGATDATTWYLDADQDGYGVAWSLTNACSQPTSGTYVTNADDCGGTDDTIYPGAPETCDGVDRDCDGQPAVCLPQGDQQFGATELILDFLPQSGIQAVWYRPRVEALGDLDGDGDDDIAVSVPDQTNSGTGRGVVQFARGPLGPGQGTIDSSLGPRIFGVDPDDRPRILWSGPDISGDGQDDFLVGSPENCRWCGAADGGSVHLFSGWPAGDLDLDDGIAEVSTALNFVYIGESATSADLDGDGNAEVLIGAPGWDEGTTDHGAVMLFTTPLPTLHFVQGPGNTTLFHGDVPNTRLGDDLDSGDLDGDGYDDWWTSDAGHARVRVVQGAAAAAGGGNISVESDIDLIVGSDDLGRHEVMDLDGDGALDFVWADLDSTEGGLAECGTVYVTWGPLTAASYDATDIGTRFLCTEAYHQLGAQLVNMGDMGNDGIDDLGVSGAVSWSTSAWRSAAYLIEGSAGFAADEWMFNQRFRYTVRDGTGNHEGSELFAVGDLNNDGYRDMGVIIDDYLHPTTNNDRRLAIIYGGTP